MKIEALILVAVVGVSAGGCARVQRSGNTVADTSQDCIADSVAPPGINRFVNGSDAAVIGHVESISDPKWNSTDGRSFGMRDASHVYPMRYREATLTVKEVLWKTANVDTSAGESLTVRVRGDGSASGCKSDIAPGERVRTNEGAGMVAQGTDVLWVLKRAPFYLKDGDKMRQETFVTIAGSFLGNWKVESDTAVNLSHARTVPFDALVNRLRAERARGFQPNDNSGRYNPLETAQPADESSSGT